MEAAYINWIITIAVALGGGMLKMHVKRINEDLQAHKNEQKDLQKEINDVKINYVHKTDFNEFKNELWSRFDRLEDHIRVR